MADVVLVLRVLHILTAILMAWPFYALVAVNQRAGFGPPVGDRLDTYVEGLVRSRVVPCFVLQATVMGTGLALILVQGLGFGVLLEDLALGAKFLLLIFIAGLLGYVHVTLQPKIDALFAASPDGPVSSEVAEVIAGLRLRRKRMASVCLFSVLTMAMLGVQSGVATEPWLTVTMLAALALFTYRAYTSTTPYGWA